MTIAEALADGRAILEIADVPEPRRDANALLRLAISRDNAFVIAHPEYALKLDEEERFREYIERRATREPIQYIAGATEFYGLEFEVTPDVLIPRPETELIVERAIAFMNELEKPVFCEIGVGSGCISVSILVNVANAKCKAVDVSVKALAVAGGNARRHRVENRIDLIISNVFSRVSHMEFDLIASNPPYVPSKVLETLQVEVGQFEPHSALSDGSDGLTIIRKIIDGAPVHLRPGGLLLMEIGFDQAAAVEKMFDSGIWGIVQIEPDLQGIPRMVKAVRK